MADSACFDFVMEDETVLYSSVHHRLFEKYNLLK